jgi:hypothetical protein
VVWSDHEMRLKFLGAIYHRSTYSKFPLRVAYTGTDKDISSPLPFYLWQQ